MKLFDWFSRAPKIEKRSAMSGFTAEIISARDAYIGGRRGIAELTATAQTCVSLWENGFCIADVQGAPLLNRSTMALIGRSLALRGESVFLIDDDQLIPCSDWDLRTRNGKPVAYRLSISEAGGGRSETALAGEVLHIRIGCDPSAPYYGQAPLRRASLTASTLNAIECTLSEVYENAPVGSSIVPMPEQPETDNTSLSRSFRGQRGRVLLRESVQVSAAGGATPQSDWKPAGLTPDLSGVQPVENVDAARTAVCGVFGILPTMLGPEAQGPAIREGQRHLSQWTLQPIAELIAEEATAKLGSDVVIDVMTPTQSFDAGGSSRALGQLVEAMARAKEANLPPEVLAAAFHRVDW